MSDGVLPAVGTELVGRRRKPAPHFVYGTVVEDEGAPSGKVLQVGEQKFQSLSDAATKLVGHRRNGWRWWRYTDGSRLRKPS